MENETLNLLQPPPDDRLMSWLSEIYGKKVEIKKRELLRHRDLSFVERLHLQDAIPETVIYKVVLPPWDIEQYLHEQLLIPSVSNSARLYLAGYYKDTTALFFEDLGRNSLLDEATCEQAVRAGTEIAKLHRAFTYRISEVKDAGILRTIAPADYPTFCQDICQLLKEWKLLSPEQESDLQILSSAISSILDTEPISLVHGDLYAENILLDKTRFFIIDWSWFVLIGAPIVDLATLAMKHVKNGSLSDYRHELIDAYCAEYSRNLNEVLQRLPYAEAMSRIFFLQWLTERRSRGIMGTTVGPVDDLIVKIVQELQSRLYELRGS